MSLHGFFFFKTKINEACPYCPGPSGRPSAVGPGRRNRLAASFRKVTNGEFGARVGGVFHINQTWGVVAFYDHSKLFDENLNAWAVGASF